MLSAKSQIFGTRIILTAFCVCRAQPQKKLQKLEVNPAIGFDNMKKVASIKKSEDRQAAEQQILEGKPADTVAQLMKQHKNDDPRQKLEKEKNRLEKTITALQQRLQYVEESLENL